MTDSFVYALARSNEDYEEGLVSDEEDEDYDALNNETFGDDSWGGDWEESHEKLAEIAELNRHGFSSEVNGAISDQINSFLLEEEQPGERLPFQSSDSIERPNDNIRPTPRPPPGFNDGFLLDQGQPQHPLALKNVCTVEEIERGLIKPPPTSLRLEDLERKLISAVGSFSPVPQPLGRHIINRPISNITPTSVLFGPTHPLYNHPLFIRPPVSSHVVRIPNRQGPVKVWPMPFYPPARMSKDPYAGLMTKSEKLWISSIQLMQLQTNHQFHSDYYYLMYHHRHSGGRKINPLKPSRELPNAQKTYSPQQFENSLGKLQAGSVTAPRKMIDTEIVEKSSVESPSASSSSRKHKQILLEIELMYNDVLKAEEMISPLMLHAQPMGEIDESPKEIFSKTVHFLTKDGKLKAFMDVRKGKHLVVRVMSHCDLADPLAEGILNLLPHIAGRDMDQSLLRALPSIRHYLHTIPKADLVFLANRIQPHLAFLLSDTFGVSIVCNMLERGDTLGLESDADWCQMIGALQAAKEVKIPVVRIQTATLIKLLGFADPPLSPSIINLLTNSLATLTKT